MAIFDAPTPEVILGSDLLRKTPKEILAHSYCLNQEAIAKVLSPIRNTVLIGPPNGCYRTHADAVRTPTYKQHPVYHDTYPVSDYDSDYDPYYDHQQYSSQYRKNNRDRIPGFLENKKHT